MATASGFTTGIADVPRQPNQEDLLGLEVYQDALCEYLKYTGTPFTIALQGERGSGKSSLMSSLRYSLCETAEVPFFGVWINTWPFALLHTPTQAVLGIVESMIKQLGALNPNREHWKKSKHVMGALIQRLTVAEPQQAAPAVGLDAGAGLLQGDAASDVEQLKTELVRLITEVLESNPDKRGFIFFIDDLDHLEPPLSVALVELLKNLFDLNHCVLVLALDYNVVVKGLQPKLGALTTQNEREFRAYFDQLVQLPFALPVVSSACDHFLVQALQAIAFFSSEELNNPDLVRDLSAVARLSVGANPRALKRLINTLSLIAIINRQQGQKAQEPGAATTQPSALDTRTKKLCFALVCIQIAYPLIYHLLLDNPDFMSWNSAFATRVKAPVLDMNMDSALSKFEEFNVGWKQVLFRLCQQEPYLQQSAFDLSQLLSKIALMVNDDSALGQVIAQVMTLTEVTNARSIVSSASTLAITARSSKKAKKKSSQRRFAY